MAEQQGVPGPEEIGKVIDDLKAFCGFTDDEKLFRGLIALLNNWPENRRGGSDVVIMRLGQSVASAIRRAKRLLRVKSDYAWMSVATYMFLAYAAARRGDSALEAFALDPEEIDRALRKEDESPG